jgi:hypothetical protein
VARLAAVPLIPTALPVCPPKNQHEIQNPRIPSVPEEKHISRDRQRRSKVFALGDILILRNRVSALGFLLLILACSAYSQTPQGAWRGTLAAPNDNVPLVFYLNAGGHGAVDSKAQHFSAPLQYSVNGNQVTITVPSINGTFTGTIDGSQMSGTWTQNGRSVSLAVTK